MHADIALYYWKSAVLMQRRDSKGIWRIVVTNNSNPRSVWYLHGDAELAQVLQFASYLLHFYLYSTSGHVAIT